MRSMAGFFGEALLASTHPKLKDHILSAAATACSMY